jgi:hypothetical protein
MLKKRGQLTIFIIAGVVIAVVIVGYFFIGSSTKEESFGNAELDSKFLSMRDSFVDCYTSVAVGSLDLIGLQGGYYDFSEGSVYEDSGIFSMPYYYYEGEVLLPSLEFISNEVGQAVDEIIVGRCVDALSSENVDFDIEFIRGDTTVEINDDNVHFSTDADLKFSTEEQSVVMDLENHDVYVDSKLFSMYEIAKFFTMSHVDEPDRVDIARLTEMAESYDLYVSVSGYKDSPDRTFVLISDESVFTPNVYGFLNKYEEDV